MIKEYGNLLIEEFITFLKNTNANKLFELTENANTNGVFYKGFEIK